MKNKDYYQQPPAIVADKRFSTCVQYANFITQFFEEHQIVNWELAGVKARSPIDEKFCQPEDVAYCKYCGKLETKDSDAISCCGHRAIDLLRERKIKRKAGGSKINPDHYKVGGIEAFDILKAKLSPEELIGHCKANILTYIMRSSHKGGVEDLKKAQWYMDKLVELVDGQATS